jgi:hypothetical protein
MAQTRWRHTPLYIYTEWNEFVKPLGKDMKKLEWATKMTSSTYFNIGCADGADETCDMADVNLS